MKFARIVVPTLAPCAGAARHLQTDVADIRPDDQSARRGNLDVGRRGVSNPTIIMKRPEGST